MTVRIKRSAIPCQCNSVGTLSLDSRATEVDAIDEAWMILSRIDGFGLFVVHNLSAGRCIYRIDSRNVPH